MSIEVFEMPRSSAWQIEEV